MANRPDFKETNPEHSIKPAYARGSARFGWVPALLALGLGVSCIVPQTAEVPQAPEAKFLYNECIDAGISWPVYQGEEGFKVGEKQQDAGCDHFWQVTKTDSGKFPHCIDVKQADRSVLFKNPLDFKDSFSPINPQLRHAIDTMYANGLYDLLSIELLPQKTIVQLEATPGGPYCLPDLSKFYRLTAIINEGVGYGWPVGWPDRKVFVELPDGLNPLKVTRRTSCFPGSCGDPTLKETDFMFLNLAPNENFTIGNLDRSWVVTGNGPLALPLKWVVNNQESVIGRLILPDSGFAEDKPLKLLPNQFID